MAILTGKPRRIGSEEYARLRQNWVVAGHIKYLLDRNPTYRQHVPAGRMLAAYRCYMEDQADRALQANIINFADDTDTFAPKEVRPSPAPSVEYLAAYAILCAQWQTDADHSCN